MVASAPQVPPATEIEQLARLASDAGEHVEVSVACRVPFQGTEIPVHTFALGNPSLEVPAVGFFGGVHGLERIGARVVIAFLEALVGRLAWDETLHDQLQRVRLVFMPLVNPGGLLRGTRANPAGVDLMRNAPVDALEPVPWLVGGQRISRHLPWYRGRAGEDMEAEGRAVCEVVRRQLHARPFSLALDCHSGFGMRDRIWFPYAHRRTPIEHLPELHALQTIFRQSHLHHPYLFEPQSRQYLAHGDLWDHLYREALPQAGRVFLPLTLEMGSWLWVKKNPRQLFSRSGIFNPLIEHREHRVLRRHGPLLEFAIRAAASWRQWLPTGAAREPHRLDALRRWYRSRT